VATQLVVSWGIAFTPDGRIFVTERHGRVRVIDHDGLQPVPEIDLTSEVYELGEGGLMGITVDPDFLNNGFFYVMYTHRVLPSQAVNRVQRLVETSPGMAEQDLILLDGILGASIHDGGRIKIGPDGKLWITTGTTRCAAGAQDLNSLDGKILRMNLDGSAPDDNPFSDYPLIYSYGHRNPQGIAWDSSGQPYATEHGPTTDWGRLPSQRLALLRHVGCHVHSAAVIRPACSRDSFRHARRHADRRRSGLVLSTVWSNSGCGDGPSG